MNETKTMLLDCLKRSGWEWDPPSTSESLRDLGLDSLGFALWIVEVERSAAVKFPPARLSNGKIDTIDSLAALVEEIRGGKK